MEVGIWVWNLDHQGIWTDWTTRNAVEGALGMAQAALRTGGLTDSGCLEIMVRRP